MSCLYICLIGLNILALNNAWNIEFDRENYTVFMDYDVLVPFNLSGRYDYDGVVSLEILSEDKNIIVLGENQSYKFNLNNLTMTNGYTNSSILLHGVFLGQTRLIFTLSQNEDGDSEELQPIDIKVIRKLRIIDNIFTGSVIILVMLIYINFGCVLDWNSLKLFLRRPIGPAIGFFGQFLVMPLLAYVIGIVVFANRPEMRLGLLFTGVSPAGGASNMWTFILDGNIDLSITMTTLSTLAAFVMMPLWLFTVGPHIFAEARLGVPYKHIAQLAAGLIIPLVIGWLIQRFVPQLSKILVRVLKTFSVLLILFIVIFAIATNLYLFHLATWEIVLAGLLLPWCGYLLGAGLAYLFKQSPRDIIAISIETGVQNTGIAIFLLRFALPEPQDDLTTIVPVAVATLTPIPLTLLFIWRKFKSKDTLTFDETAVLH